PARKPGGEGLTAQAANECDDIERLAHVTCSPTETRKSGAARRALPAPLFPQASGLASAPQVRPSSAQAWKRQQSALLPEPSVATARALPAHAGRHAPPQPCPPHR